jgi:hypothetical protein
MLLALQIEQRLAVACVREAVQDGDAFGLLLEREVTHVGDEHCEFFLVIRTAQSLGAGFDEDDAGVGGWLLGEGSGAVGVAVVRDVDPAAIADVGCGGLGLSYLSFEHGHADTVDRRGTCGGARFDVLKVRALPGGEAEG